MNSGLHSEVEWAHGFGGIEVPHPSGAQKPQCRSGVKPRMQIYILPKNVALRSCDIK